MRLVLVFAVDGISKILTKWLCKSFFGQASINLKTNITCKCRLDPKYVLSCQYGVILIWRHLQCYRSLFSAYIKFVENPRKATP